jgi:hypothetical protein
MPMMPVVNLVRYYDDIGALISSQTVLIPNVVRTEDERNVVTAQAPGGCVWAKNTTVLRVLCLVAVIRTHIIAIPRHVMTSRCGEHVSYSCHDCHSAHPSLRLHGYLRLKCLCICIVAFLHDKFLRGQYQWSRVHRSCVASKMPSIAYHVHWHFPDPCEYKSFKLSITHAFTSVFAHLKLRDTG